MFKIGYRAIYQKNIYSAIQEAKRNNFDVLEIHLSSPQFLPLKYSVKELKSLKDLANKQNITLQVHAPLEQSLIFISEELRKGAKKQLEEMVQFSKLLGAKCLTLHIGKVATYHTTNGKALKDDDIYLNFYKKLFEDSIRHIISIALDNLFICIENTDNFTLQYRKVLDRYFSSGKLFLTWDIRKSYSYTTNELNKEQWEFVRKNKCYVRNLHISGFGTVHGEIKGWEEKLKKFIELFDNEKLSLIIEIMPIKYALEAKKAISRLIKSIDN